MNKIRVSLYNARPGMTVANDVFSPNGQLLIPTHSKLTPEILDKMFFYAVPFITIYDNEDEPSKPEPLLADPSYSDRIRNSKEFKQFQEEFNTALGDVNQSLEHIVTTNDTIDADKLLDQTTSLLAHSTTSIGVLDMLNNLRVYDDSTYAHSLNVSIICRIFGQWLHFSQSDIDALTVAGILHDLGKLLIPPEVIKKPDKLSDEEYALIRKHPYLGYKHVENNPSIDSRIKAAILMHHEKCDGSGYPSQLTLHNIHPFARIVAIADVYDAMTANRVYREGLCPFHVIRMFEDEGYQSFDVQYLLPFLTGIIQSYINNRVRLTDGSVGEIIFINNQALSRPIVKVKDQFIDLSVRRDLLIEQIL